MELPKYKFYLGLKENRSLVSNSFSNFPLVWRQIVGDGLGRKSFAWLPPSEADHIDFTSNFYCSATTTSQLYSIGDALKVLSSFESPTNFNVPVAYVYNQGAQYPISKIIEVPAFQLWQFDENLALLNPINYSTCDYSALAFDFHRGLVEGLYENTKYIFIAIYQGYKPEATLLRGLSPAEAGQFGDDIHCFFNKSIRYNFTLQLGNSFIFTNLERREPIYSELTKEIEQEDDNVYFRTKLSGTLFYQGNNFDFIELNRDSFFDFYIEKLDRSALSYRGYFIGVFKGVDCQFDYTLKKVTPNIQPRDEYYDITNCLDKEFDIIRDLPMPLLANTYIWQNVLMQFYIEGAYNVTTVFPGGLYDDTDVEPKTSFNGWRIANTSFFRAGRVGPSSNEVTIFMRILFSKEVVNHWVDFTSNAAYYEDPSEGAWAPYPKGYVAFNPEQTIRAAVEGFPQEFTNNFIYVNAIDEGGSSRYPSPFGLTGATDAEGYPLYYSKPAIESSLIYGVPICKGSWGSYSVWFKYNISGITLPIRNGYRPTADRWSWRNDSLQSRLRYKRPFNDAYTLKTIIEGLLKLNNLYYLVDDSAIHDILDSSFNGDIQIALSPNTNILNYEHTLRATTGILSLKKIFDMLKNMFNIYWYIDGVTIKFKALKDIYQGMDTLYLNKYDQFNKKRGLFAQEVINANSAQLVSSQQLVRSNNGSWPFSLATIDYTDAFLKGEKVQKYEVNDFDVDIDFMLYKPDSFNKDNWAVMLFYKPRGHSDYYLSIANVQQQGGRYYYTTGIIYNENNEPEYGPAPVQGLSLPFKTFGAISVQELNKEEPPSPLNIVPNYVMSQNFGCSPFAQLSFFAYAGLTAKTNLPYALIGSLPIELRTEEVQYFMGEDPEVPAKVVTLYGERKQIEGRIVGVSINLNTRLVKIKINY